MADTIKIGNLDISSFKVGAADCSIYLGDVKVYPTSSPTYTELEYVQLGDGSSTGGFQLFNNVTSDYYFEVESELVNNPLSITIVGEKSSVEIVSYQLGLCYYFTPYLDYGGARIGFNTNQNVKHLYGCGYISGNTGVIGVTVDGLTMVAQNTTPTVEGLPYLVGPMEYTSHTGADFRFTYSNASMKIYSVKIYTNYGQTLVGDYIPVLNENNVATLYDKVSQSFVTPYGTIIAGPTK